MLIIAICQLWAHSLEQDSRLLCSHSQIEHNDCGHPVLFWEARDPLRARSGPAIAVLLALVLLE